MLLRSALIQLASFATLLALLVLAVRRGWSPQLWPLWLLPCALLAFELSRRWRLPRWWWWINAGFLPALLLADRLDLHPALYAGGLLFTLLLFGATFRSRVPLWLSGGRARRALIELLPADRPLRLLDLGGGVAGVLVEVGRARPQVALSGIEWAPLPWALGWLRLRLAGIRADWRCRDFWSLDFGQFDLLFAYLSPAPMAELWAKAQRELAPGARLVSYRFEIAGVRPRQKFVVGPRSDDVLWVYQPR